MHFDNWNIHHTYEKNWIRNALVLMDGWQFSDNQRGWIIKSGFYEQSSTHQLYWWRIESVPWIVYSLELQFRVHINFWKTQHLLVLLQIPDIEFVPVTKIGFGKNLCPIIWPKSFNVENKIQDQILTSTMHQKWESICIVLVGPKLNVSESTGKL